MDKYKLVVMPAFTLWVVFHFHILYLDCCNFVRF
jgi:hypothetical protein